MTQLQSTHCVPTEKKEFRLRPAFLDISHLLSWEDLHKNPNAIDLLDSHFEYISWNKLSGNKNAGKLFAKCPDLDLLCWDRLLTNYSAFEYGLFDNLETFNRMTSLHGLSRNPHPKAIEFLKQNTQHICWEYISGNSGDGVLDIIIDNFHRVNVGTLSTNTNPRVIQFIEENGLLEHVSWKLLSANPSAVHILKNNEHMIDWYYASKNPNPEMCELFERNIGKIDWGMISLNPGAIRFIERALRYVDWAFLSENPAAIHILENNLDKVDFDSLSRNPSIFGEYEIADL
jgi:hypothetical protein